MTTLADLNTGSQRDLPALTGIRGFASWWVVLYHLWPTLLMILPFIRPLRALIQVGELGVDIFFVLSGFILTHTHRTRLEQISLRNYVEFLKLRLARIYPTHLLFLFVWLAIFGVNRIMQRHDVSSSLFSWTAFVQNVLLIQAWTCPLRLTWNYPAWSVSLEWLAYLAFPLLLLAFRSWSLLTSMLALTAVCVIAPIASNFPLTGHLSRVFLDFAAGILLYSSLSRELFINRNLKYFVAAIGPVALVAIVALRQTSVPPQSIVLFICLLIGALCFENIGLGKIFASRLMVHLGKVSYALYLSHAAVITVLHNLLPVAVIHRKSVLVRGGAALIYFLALFVIAEFVYRAVEKPARNYISSVTLSRINKRPTQERSTEKLAAV